jgi:hypothetical protein
MGSSVVSRWTACIKELQAMLELTARLQVDAANERIRTHLQFLDRREALPRAVCKKLITETKVGAMDVCPDVVIRQDLLTGAAARY